MTTREKLRQIRARLGLAEPDVRSGSTVLQRDVRDVAEALDVPWAGSIQRTWRAIIAALGGVPDDDDTSHEGSGTITDAGFDKVLHALDQLLDAPLPESIAARASAQRTPADEAEGRERVLAEIVRRRGQAAFRRSLLDAYSSHCCISGAVDAEVLEAAHIRQYNGPVTNIVTNGLLLRSDLHTLFDLGLIAIDEAYRVLVSPTLQDPVYTGLDGTELRLPVDAAHRPSLEALAEHRALTGL